MKEPLSVLSSICLYCGLMIPLHSQDQPLCWLQENLCAKSNQPTYLVGLQPEESTLLYPIHVPNGPVFASCEDGNGGMFITGSFTKVGDQQRMGLAHFDSCGQLTDWARTSSVANIHSIVAGDHEVIVAGSFQTVNGIVGSSGAVFSKSTKEPFFDFPTVTPDPYLGKIIVAESDGNGGYYLGGNFVHVGDYARRNIAHIDSNFQVTSFHPHVGGTVNDLVIAGDKIFLAGDFWASGQDDKDLVIADPVTSETRSFEALRDRRTTKIAGNDTLLFTAGFPNSEEWDGYDIVMLYHDGRRLERSIQTDGIIEILHVEGDRLYIGGTFNTIDGQTRPRIGSIDLSSLEVTDWNPSLERAVEALSVTETQVLVSQRYYGPNSDGYNAYVVSLDVTTGERIWEYGIDGLVLDIDHDDTLVYVGGFIGPYHEAKGLITLRPESGVLVDDTWKVSGEIHAIVVGEEDLFLGGRSTEFGGSPRKHICSFSKEEGVLTNWNPSPSRPPSLVAAASGKVFIAVSDNSKPATISVYDEASKDSIPWHQQPEGYLIDLQIDNDTLYLLEAQGADLRLVSIDLATSSRSALPLRSYIAEHMDIKDEKLWIAANYYPEHRDNRQDSVVVYNRKTGQKLGWVPVPGEVQELEIHDDKVFVSGYGWFMSIDRQSLAMQEYPARYDLSIHTMFSTGTALFMAGWNASIASGSGGIPAPPVIVAESTPSHVTLHWGRQAVAGDSIIIQRSVETDDNFQWLATVARDNGFFFDEKVTTGTTYFYRAQAKNTCGIGPLGEQTGISYTPLSAINSDNLQNLSIYPNPFSNSFVLDLKSGESADYVEVHDLLGKRVLSLQQVRSGESITVPGPSGIYVLQAQVQGKSFLRKIRKL